jgi:hypothetical protein
MTDYASIQSKINRAYGKCALKIGVETSIYRAPNGINPISINNFIGTTFLSQNVAWSYMKSNKFNNLFWQLVIDRTQLKPYDYLVNEQFTFYVSDMEPIAPTSGIECNRIISLTRPNQDYVAGSNSYGGYDPNTEIQIMENCPVGILTGGRMEKNPFGLPLDTRSPSYIVYIPNLPGVAPRIGDFINDDRAVKLALSSVELTSLGYRCFAVSEQV